MSEKRPTFDINKLHAYIDEQLDIKVIGCEPNELITIRAKMVDDDGKTFESYATFEVTKDEALSLSNAKPIEGSYNEIDASGLFWSMKRTHSKHDDFFEKKHAEAVSVELFLEIADQIIDSVIIKHHFYKENLKKEIIKENDLTGVLYYPEHAGALPGILLLGGSDGGYLEPAAALLASHGYTVLSLAYFGTDGVPENLENIPLEYFQHATQWLKEHPSVNQNISLIGFSRGGELALLLGSTYDEYAAVIAVSPSSYMTAGMRNDVFAPIPSWTLKGEALPYLKFSYPPSMFFTMLRNWITKRPASFLSIWNRSMRDLDKLEDARIQVEKIKAPLMTITGSNDQLWPSAKFVKLMEKQLSDGKARNNYVHLSYEDAGHFLAFPYSFPSLPSNVTLQIGGSIAMSFGGSKSANAKATQDSWPKIINFIENAMKREEAK